MKTPLILGSLGLLAITIGLLVVGSGGDSGTKTTLQPPPAEPVDAAPAPALAQSAPAVEAAPAESMPASRPLWAPGQTVLRATDHRITKEAKYYIRYPDGRVEERTGMMTATPEMRKAPIVQRKRPGAKTEEEKVKPENKEAPASQPAGATSDN